jgi:hypothetical protein
MLSLPVSAKYPVTLASSQTKPLQTYPCQGRLKGFTLTRGTEGVGFIF